MAATFVTKEKFPPNTSKTALNKLIKERMRAGAIRCWIKAGTKYIVCTEWNIIGSND